MSDTSVQVPDPLSFQTFFQGFIEFSSITPSFRAVVHINGHFTRVVIGSPSLEDSGIGIALNNAVFFQNQIRILLERILYTAAEFCCCGDNILKRNSRIRDIICIYFQQLLCILRSCAPDLHTCG